MITTAPELIYMLKVNIASPYSMLSTSCSAVATLLPVASYRTAEFSCPLFSLLR